MVAEGDLRRRHRDDAVRQLELFEARYRDEENGAVPIGAARRWARAFEGEEVDLDAMADLLREMEKEKNRHGLTFHASYNTMRRIYHELVEDFLTRRAAGPPPPDAEDDDGAR